MDLNSWDVRDKIINTVLWILEDEILYLSEYNNSAGVNKCNKNVVISLLKFDVEKSLFYALSEFSVIMRDL